MYVGVASDDVIEWKGGATCLQDLFSPSKSLTDTPIAQSGRFRVSRVLV